MATKLQTPEFDILAIPRQRIKRNQNWLAMICGDTGTGKSWSGLSIGVGLDPSFNAQRIYFKIKDLLFGIRDSQPGQVFMMDEAGVEFGSRDFMTERNREFGKILQVFRFLNLYLIWTLPDMSMIDITARRLMHTYIETVAIDYEKEESIVRWFQVVIKRREGDIHYILVRGVDQTGAKYRLDPVRIPRPPQFLIDDYEKHKRNFFEKHITKLIGGTTPDVTREEVTQALEIAGVNLGKTLEEEKPATIEGGKLIRKTDKEILDILGQMV